MKKTVFMLAVISILSGFHSSIPPKEGNSRKDQEVQQRKQEQNEKTAKKEASLIPSDKLLKLPGESMVNKKGMLTLLAASPVYDLFILGGVELIVKDVKVLNFNPSNTQRAFMTKEEIEFLKIDVEITNQNPFTVKFNPIDSMMLNNIVLHDGIEFLQEGMDGMIGGGETKIGSLGYIIKKSDSANYDIDVRTGKVINQDGKDISKAASFNITLNGQP